jgi:transglutaminase-like putative cysteine protease
MEIPCRYVSGYICPHKNGMRGEGATHAWVEAWIPGYGWAGVDPTNNIWVTNTHVKLAVGRNFTDCSVVKGTFKGPARQDLYVFVSVGYEDGVTFEETNQVQMEKQKKAAKEEEIAKAAESQLQQQQ